jgi:hypothetical protein
MWDYNSPWPSDMLGYYRKIHVDTPSGTTAEIAIRRYRNNDSHSHASADKGGTQQAVKIKDALLGVGSDVLSRAGGAQDYVNVFTGKGSPEAIGKVLGTMIAYSDRFIKKYLNSSYPYSFVAQQMDDPSLSWEEALQNIADEFLGLDCNGFVGNWLKRADKGLKLNEQSGPGTVRAKSVTRRMHLDEIEEWDVVIWDQNVHIAVIEQTGSSASKFWMCQSAGEGPVMHEYVFTESASGVFQKTGGGPPATEVGGNVAVYNMWPA